ncbi:MAG: hypothetical protein ACREJB_15570, partial [Planctomycetaceae bacterium]
VGRRTISRYGCYACHDVPGFEEARPIGTALQDWGRKDKSRLAFEHIAEFLHHHGEPDGSSTRDRVVTAMEKARSEEFSSEEIRAQELSAAYFYEDLLHHGRAGFLWQKLRQPRSYDYLKTETKRYDERLRMPKFTFSTDPKENEAAIEAIATFVLGLVAEPPAAEYIYNPTPEERDRLAGEELLDKYNCTACHIVDLPRTTFSPNPQIDGLPRGASDLVGMSRDDLVQWFVEHRDELLKLEEPQGPQNPAAEPAPTPEFPEAVQMVLDNAAVMLDGEKSPAQWAKELAGLVKTEVIQPADAEAQAELNAWFREHDEILIYPTIDNGDFPESIRLLIELQPPQD